MYPFTFCLHKTRCGSALAALIILTFLTWASVVEAKHHGDSAYQVIVAVDEGAKTVTIGHEHTKDHSVKTLKVTGFTEITVDGQKATLHDLQKGMMVQIETEADDVAASLEAKHVMK